MGILGYSFVNLTKEQIAIRRLALDYFAFIAQISGILVVLAVGLYRVALWLTGSYGKSNKEQIPSSPYLKAAVSSNRATWMRSLSRCKTRLQWWMADELVDGFGSRSQWVCGGVWALWLVVLCIKDTGNDYMHLTKRFGIIAASQLPMHFLLAVKSPYSPLQLLVRMSHEQLNGTHQVLGRIIQLLLTLHAVFYINFFVRVNVLAKRLKDLDVILGMFCIAIITILTTSALRAVRRANYRVFYILHVVLAALFLPLAYFHVHHIRKYVLESATVYLLHSLLRFINTKTITGSISLLPETTLMQITLPMPQPPGRFRPGQHVYLSLSSPFNSSMIPSIFLHNPFTIASLPGKDQSLLLIARVLKGNTKQFAATAEKASMDSTSTLSIRPFKVEGPYGASIYLPDLHKFDRILFIAGGVGATFILPLWRATLAKQYHENGRMYPDLRLIWTVRHMSETSWALPLLEARSDEGADQDLSNVEVFITGGANSHHTGPPNTLELHSMDAVMPDVDRNTLFGGKFRMQNGRPDLYSVVAEICGGHGRQVAVLVCGPAGLTRSLRHEVKRQVLKGKEVFWHAEEFGL